MPKIWGFTQKREYWATFFSATDPAQRKMPLLWSRRLDKEEENLICEQAQIYDPFMGIALPQRVITCLGVLATCGYESPQGCTVELLPKELVPNPIHISMLITASALPEDALSRLAGQGFCPPLGTAYWDRFKEVLSETNPPLTSSLMSLENWSKRQAYLDYILDMITQRGGLEEEEQEVFAVLRALTRAEPENQVTSGQLALQTRLRVALKAQLLPVKDWERLCKNIVDAWYGYVMTLTPQEVTRLTDLNLPFDL